MVFANWPAQLNLGVAVLYDSENNFEIIEWTRVAMGVVHDCVHCQWMHTVE